MVIYHGSFIVEHGMRSKYVEEIKSSKLIDCFRRQNGNLFYSVGESVTDEDEIIVCDAWESKEDYIGHVNSQEVAAWHEIYHRYVTDCKEAEYEDIMKMQP